MVENDFLAIGNQDRWLSSHLQISYAAGPWRYAIANEMYTPKDKRSADIPEGDRPWDGYSYFQAGRIFESNDLDSRFFAVRVGALGDASKTKRIQKFAHNDLGWGSDPQGWDTQNPSELALEVLIDHSFRSFFDSWIGRTALETTYGIRAGNVQDYLFLSQSIVKQYPIRENLLSYFAVGLSARAVAYNTHLQGRLFRDNIYTVDHNWFVAESYAGLGLSYKKYFVEYVYKYQTEEFKGQAGRHLFGSLHIGMQW